ncbi:MAG: ComEC/Rec2 family competence protein [Taibaiella sp.]|jgi:competence protein ComEC
MKKYATKQVDLFSQYPFLVILTAFIAGILLQQYLNDITVAYWFAATVLLFIAGLLLQLIRSIHKNVTILRTIAIVTAFLMLGATISNLGDIKNSKSWYGHFVAKAEAIKVKVTDAPVMKANTVLVPVTVNAINVSGRWIKVTGDLGLYIYKKDLRETYQAGTTLIIPNKLSQLKSSGNPFAFDFAKMSARKGIFHQAFLSAKEVGLLKTGTDKASSVLQLKHALQVSIDENVKDSTTRALIAATILNERSELDQDLMAAYSNTGIIHIIAISGMHIVLLASFILWILKIIPSAKWKGIKYGIAIVIVWFYIALTGFPPSAVRAAVMFTLLAVGLTLSRINNPVNIWAAAGLLILCYNPYWLYDVGVQLSFLAVLSIILFYTPVKAWLSPKNKISRWLWDVIAVSIAAQILVFPLVIYYFNQFPLLGLVASVPAALYSTLLMFGALLMFVLHAISCPAVWLGTGLTYLTKLFNGIIIFLSDCTPQLMRSLYIDPLEYWLFMGIVVLLCVYCFYKRGTYLLTVLCLSILFTTDLITKDIIALRQERLVVYNTNKVSQADWFQAKKVTHLFPADTKQLRYYLRPAMLGYGINKEDSIANNAGNLIQLKHTTILFLERCQIKPSGKFPVDVLVLSNSCLFSPEEWFETFHPKQIILDGSIPRWKAIKWKKHLQDNGAHVHWVQEDGAWIYPSI